MDDLQRDIESWLSVIHDAGGIAMMASSPSKKTKTMPVTPSGSPRKRSRSSDSNNGNSSSNSDDVFGGLPSRPAINDDDDYDPDTTPMVTRVPPLTIDDSTSQRTGPSSTSGTSQAGSPQKREMHLRRAPDYPIDRRPIAALRRDISRNELDDTETDTDTDTSIHALLDALYNIMDKEKIIPDIFQPEIERDPTSELPRRRWFYPTPRSLTSDENEVKKLTYRHQHLQAIADDAQFLETQLVNYEPEWNDLVHGQILKEAFSEHASIGARDVTVVRIAKPFREPTESNIGESKIDYALFSSLPSSPPTPSSSSTLSTSSFYQSLPQFTTLDEARPWIVGIETKSLAHDHVSGPVQLAKWARAHFRWLEHVVDAAALQNVFLPLVFVLGNTWELSFATRRDNKTVIYGHLSLGSTNTIVGCYQVCMALRCVGDWAAKRMMTWWAKVADRKT